MIFCTTTKHSNLPTAEKLGQMFSVWYSRVNSLCTIQGVNMFNVYKVDYNDIHYTVKPL
jgi:hypothetical protein